MLIGTAALSSQRGFAQNPGEGASTFAVDDARLRPRFEALLLESRSRDLAAGFELARSLGPGAAPLLWAMHAAEKSNARRRITMLCAAVFAEGPLGDDRVLAALEQEKTPLDDRLSSLFLAALGPVRERTQPQFWTRALGRNKQEPVQLLQVVALLASARWPGVAATAPAASLREGDPGVIAAALLAGAPVPDAVVQPYWKKNPPPHAALVWRGAFLGRLLDRDADLDREQELLAHARDVLAMSGEVHATARAAAALVLGRAAAFDRDVRPDWHVLQLFAGDRRAAASVPQWLSAAPNPLADDPTRLAVEYVLSRDVEAVIAERAQWGAAPTVRTHVALALAWRLCEAAAPTPIDWSLAEVPEWYLVRWASGVRATPDAEIADPVLAQAARLAAQDRLPRDVARRLFEEALWRLGSHPGLGLWQAHRDLVRDLVLSGSVPGSRYQIGLPDHQRYVPGGLRHEDDFFEVAVEAFEFLSRRVPPIPAECRLR